MWHTLLPDANALQAEFEWLKAKVYLGSPARVQVEKLDAWVKYSARSGEKSMQQV